jgi:hypothetical protein
MPTQITISSLSGLSPFDVYACDTGYTTCIYVDTIGTSEVPYSFDLPFILEGMASCGVKVVDSNNCIVKENLSL